MKKHQSLLKLFVVLFFCTAFIFSSSHFGAKAFENFTNAGGSYSEGTSVGSVDLSGKSESEAVALLEEKYIEWVKNTKVELQYSEKIVTFDINLFTFDAVQTVYSIKEGQSNMASMSIELLQVEEQIGLLFPQLDQKELELTKLITDLKNTASKLETGTFSFNLNKDYLVAGANQDEVISKAIVKLTDIPSDLETVVTKYPELKIAEGATFSLLEFVKQEKLENSTSLNVIATGMYQSILPTNFEIVERNISNALPVYAGLGFEAKVNVAKGTDFIITNPNKTPYTFELELENNNLIVSLKGANFLYDYKISKKDEQLLKPKTIVQYSALVNPGQIKVENNGADGQLVKVYRDIYHGTELFSSELLVEDYYPPVYRIEIHGLTGSKDGSTQTTGATTTTGPTGSQTTSSTDNVQQDSNDDLWGKPNEQPK
nr:VanW family protein [Neobacillus sp. Marseille-Q6967]